MAFQWAEGERVGRSGWGFMFWDEGMSLCVTSRLKEQSLAEMISLLTNASIHWWQPVEIITQIALLLFYSSVAFVPRWARSTPSLRWVGSLSLLEDFLQLCDRSNGLGLSLRLALMCLCFCFLLDVSPPSYSFVVVFFGGGCGFIWEEAQSVFWDVS